ncbi:hypothetical protein BAE44_0011289 [Dichanthelium oligosanthes]|uniref:AB hydrolase-1 domain-containing protein n=1 Tax=Dichanthelium oligosanthes TaxID=888268 RepID=A0A1E5VRH2_9POAL|nr:hypothetical protein BAE44_0011289 [Dichanthelium oligosanthes]
MSRCIPCATSSVPAASKGSSSSVAFSPCGGAFSYVSGRLRWGTRPRGRHATVAASSKDESGTAEEDDPGFNPFGFVTDNPSSRSAIQLPAVPAEDGNVDAGYHCFAPDWIGFGFSEMPQPGYGFDYKEEEFHKAFDDLIITLNITEPFFLVVQGFLVGSYGLTWALNNSSKVLKLAILNSPLTVNSPVPGVFQQLSYKLKLEKADVYRLPYLSSGAPGFALLEAARKVNFQDVLSRISAGFSSNSWEKPILLAWGISDKYLPLSIAEEFKKANPDVVKLEAIEGAGHMPQEDWPEKVVKALISFL